MSDEIEFTTSSGNVFADLGFDDPDLEVAKSDLAYQIGRIIAARGWTQMRAAETLGVDQPKVSKIVRGRLGDFSVERLMQYLTKLNQDVRIVVGPNLSSKRSAGITVHAVSPDETQSPHAEAGIGPEMDVQWHRAFFEVIAAAQRELNTDRPLARVSGAVRELHVPVRVLHQDVVSIQQLNVVRTSPSPARIAPRTILESLTADLEAEVFV